MPISSNSARPDDLAERDGLSPPESSVLGDGLDFLGLLFRRKWLIAFCVIISTAFGVLYYLRKPPVYKSTAQVFVSEKTTNTLPIQGADAATQYGTSLSDHSAIISSPLIIQRAIKEKKLGSLVSLAGVHDAGRILREGLEVTFDEESWTTSVLNLSYHCSDSQDCATVLNSVMQIYADFLGEMEQNVGKETTELIASAKDELLRQLTQKEDEYSRFQQGAPLFWQDGRGTNLHQQRQSQIEAVRASLDLTCAQLAARIQAVEAALAGGSSADSILLMIQQLSKNSELDVTLDQEQEGQVNRNLLSLLLTEQTLSERYGPSHPQLTEVRRQIELARTFARNGPYGGEKVEASSVRSKELTATYLDSLRERLRSATEEKKALDTLFDREQEAAKSLASFQAKDAALQNDILRTRRLFEVVVQRLEEINLIQDDGGYNIQVISPAEAGVEVAPNVLRIILAASVLGLLAGLGLAYALDTIDNTFHSPAEIGHELRLPLVGHVPQLSTLVAKEVEPRFSSLSPTICAAHRPQSRPAEAFRAIRTALYFSSRRGNHRVIQVTSPAPHDGKSTISANLAVTIADSGKRVLLLDADFRRPIQHKLFGKKNDIGLASVVDGKAEPHEAVQSTPVDNLFLMTCGPRPHNPSELLTSVEFKDLLDWSREQYDFVVIDTPPVLVVTDPGVVAARADAVLLALRNRQNGRRSAMEARNMLTALGANIVGIVVNGTSEQKGYGYGGYRGYGFGYGSPEGKNAEENAGYYDTDDDSDGRVKFAKEQ